jgi:molecular chaperone GrpE (heat shock protein)
VKFDSKIACQSGYRAVSTSSAEIEVCFKLAVTRDVGFRFAISLRCTNLQGAFMPFKKAISFLLVSTTVVSMMAYGQNSEEAPRVAETSTAAEATASQRAVLKQKREALLQQYNQNQRDIAHVQQLLSEANEECIQVCTYEFTQRILASVQVVSATTIALSVAINGVIYKATSKGSMYRKDIINGLKNPSKSRPHQIFYGASVAFGIATALNRYLDEQKNLTKPEVIELQKQMTALEDTQKKVTASLDVENQALNQIEKLESAGVAQ